MARPVDNLPCAEGERPGLQALLRGANEALALLPETSIRQHSCKVLIAGLEEILAREPPAES